MNTELHIENYRLDITNDISALLNLAIDDIKDFSARSTTWSKTIVLPGTSNNNKLFGHIFQVGQSNFYDPNQSNVGANYNAAKSANAIFFQDQLQVFKGVLRLLQVNYYGGLQGRIEYEVSVFGNLVGLNSKLSGALLEDLDFSAYNHVYNDANIVNSWDNPGGSGYYYPLIDYGTYSTNKHDWDIRTFRPALYAREFIDKMFTAAGYRWQSALFDTTRFKKLAIPHAKNQMTVNRSTLGQGQITTTKHYTFAHTGDDDILLPWDSLSGTGFSIDAPKQVFTYNGTVTTNIIISGSIDVNFTGVAFFFSIILYIYKNGKTGTLLSNPVTIFSPTSIQFSINTSMAPGDTIEFWFNGTADSLNVTAATVTFNTASGTAAIPISIGDSVIMNDHIPKNIRQIDFLVSIVKLFNLYVYEDKNDPHLIYITPYIDFYSKNFSNAVDWTNKLNHNKPMMSRPMSELNAKIYKLKFKSDSDYYNDLYRKRYNEGYGDRIYDSQFEFTEQIKEFEIVFSSTPLVGYGGEDKIYSTIFKRTGSDTAATEETTDSNIRLLQTKKITGVAPWNIKNGGAVDAPVLNTLTRYGYAGHLDDPDVPTNDLNFGATKELFFILSSGNLSDNQFNVYWSGYMREITDKDSKLFTGNFYLTTLDILALDFSKYIYVDGIAFRLNAIKDYNASKPADCVVELFKVNSASYSEAPNPNGPPDGCYLLWTDDNTMDWTDDDALLYGDCNTNPGDGGGGGPTVYYVNWGFTKNQPSGSINIFVNDVLRVSSTEHNDSGSFVVTAGHEVRISIGASFTKNKHLFVSNDVDGVMFDSSSTGLTSLSYTFTADSNKNYTIQGSVNS